MLTLLLLVTFSKPIWHNVCLQFTDCVTCCSTRLGQAGLNLKSIRFFNCTYIFNVTRTLKLTYFKWKCISWVQQLWSLNYSGANSRLYFSSILQSAARMCWTICSDTTTYSSLFSTWYAADFLWFPHFYQLCFQCCFFTNSYLMPVRFHILCQPSWKNYSI